MLSLMTDSLFPYRNRQNGHVGFTTHELAGIFPESLELVTDYVDPALIDDVAPEPAAPSSAVPTSDTKAVK